MLLIVLLSTTAIRGCKKDGADDTPAPAPPAPSVSFFQGLFTDNIADARQSFVLNATGGGQVFADQGTRLNFGPGAFLHTDGTYMSGQVDVRVLEASRIGSMIWLNKQPVGDINGTLKMQRSGGALNITATKGVGSLQISDGCLYVQVPTTVGDLAMELFSGSEDADGMMIRDPIRTAVVTVGHVYLELFYSFPSDPRHWINCDYFYSYPNLTLITTPIPSGRSTDNTRIGPSFPSDNAVVHMPHSTGQNYVTPPVLFRRSGRLAGRGSGTADERHRPLIVLLPGDHLGQ